MSNTAILQNEKFRAEGKPTIEQRYKHLEKLKEQHKIKRGIKNG